MESVLLVFIVATIATYLPIYWGFSKAFEVLNRWRAPAIETPPSVRDEFLQCLRMEAGKRGAQTLTAALQEMRTMVRDSEAPAVPLSDEWLVILAEARSTLIPLFSRSEMVEFDKITQLLAAGDKRRLTEIEDRIDAMRDLLLDRPRFTNAAAAPAKRDLAHTRIFPRVGAAQRESFGCL
jgi:hypothetical protein